jgi:hypothetical protein
MAGQAVLASFLPDHGGGNCDRAHFFPYGWNFPKEFSLPQRNIAMVSAFRADMGHSDGMAKAAGTYRLRNRATGLLLDGLGLKGNGAAVAPYSNNQRWELAYTDGYLRLRNVTSRSHLDSMGKTTDGGAAGTSPGTSANTQWEMQPTEKGHFRLINRGTGRCLDSLENPVVGAKVATWDCDKPSQSTQWRLVQ